MIPLDGDVEGGKAALQRLKKFGLNVDQFTTNKGGKCKYSVNILTRILETNSSHMLGDIMNFLEEVD